MRTRKEIEEDSTHISNITETPEGEMHLNLRLILEVLLDIRDLSTSEVKEGTK